jgi:hypothetical protein
MKPNSKGRVTLSTTIGHRQMRRLRMLAHAFDCSFGQVIEDMIQRDDATDLIDAMRIDDMHLPSTEWMDQQEGICRNTESW